MWVNFWLELILLTADYLIDFHGGGLESEIADISMYPKVGKDTDTVSRQLAINYGYRYMISHRYDPNTPNWFDNSLVTQVALREIPCFLAEFPGPGGAPLNPREVERVHKGLRNVMRYLKMIDGSPEPNVEQIFLEKMVNVPTRRGGFIHCKVKLGQRVKGRGVRNSYGLVWRASRGSQISYRRSHNEYSEQPPRRDRYLAIRNVP